MPRFLVSRRSLLAGTAAAAALVALPRAGRAQGVVKGGRLVVAADSEPTNLNPAIVASNGVFFVASKVIEPLAEASYEGKDGLDAEARHVVGRIGGRQVGHLQAARGRDLARRQAVHLRRRRLLGALGVEAAAESRARWCSRTSTRSTRRTSTPRSSASRRRRPLQLIRNALPALTAVVPKHIYDGTDIAKNPANEKLIGTGPFKLAEHKPGEYYLLQQERGLLGRGAAASRRDRLPGAARPRRRRQCAGGGRDPARRLLRRAARRSRPHLQGAGPEGLCQRLRGADLPADRGDQPHAQGARRRARAAGARPRDRPRLRREDDLPRLRQAVDRAGAGLRQDLLHRPRCRTTISIRPRPRRCSTRPAIRRAPTACASS